MVSPLRKGFLRPSWSAPVVPGVRFKYRRDSFIAINSLILPLLSCLMACGFIGSSGDIAPQEADVVSLDPQNWYIYHSGGMPLHPSTDTEGAWSFVFPSWETGGHVNYVQTPFNATTTPSTVTITFRIDSESPQYVVLDTGDRPPATFRLFFEQRGDNGSNPNGRWWAGASRYDLGPHDGETQTISMPLASDHWTNVEGQTDPQAFSAALKNVGWFGVTFGGQSFAGHGVALSGGTAKYVLIDYRVN